MKKVCAVDDCEREVKALAWCNAHLQRWRRHGDPLAGGTLRGAPRAFLESVLDGSAPFEPNGCILWPYGVSWGYARITWNGRGHHAGALVLSHFAGPRPTPEHTVGHAPHEVCGNRHCIAPAHLSWQTMQEQVDQQKRDGTSSAPPLVAGERHHLAVPVDLVREAVRRVHAGETCAAVARDLGVSRPAVSSWARGQKRRDAFEEVAVDA